MSGLVTTVEPVKVPTAGQTPGLTGACGFERVITFVAIPEAASVNGVVVSVTLFSVEENAGTEMAPAVGLTESLTKLTVSGVVLPNVS